MDAKNILYAAVGAPVVAAKKVGEVGNKLGEQASGYGKNLEQAIDGWAVEGEKVVGRISDQKVVEDITSRVDLDQAKDQVSKLRDQLEDMLATWKTSFRPEGTEAKTEDKAETKPAAKSTTAKTTAAKKPAAKSTTAKTTAAKKPAAKSTTATKQAS